MWVALITIIPAALAAVGGVFVAVKGLRESKAKAAMGPMELSSAALKVAGEWIDKLSRELKETEAECDRRIKELETEIRDLRKELRLYTDRRIE